MRNGRNTWRGSYRVENKKIAFYIGSLNKGGAERVVANLAEYFYDKKYEVYVVTKFIAKNEYLLKDGIIRVVADITKEEERGRVRNLILRIQKLRRIVKEIHPDVWVSFIGKSNLMSIAATRGTKVPAVVSVRSNPQREIGNGWKRALTFMLFYLTEGIVLQTTRAKEFFPVVVRKKAVVLQNSINKEFIRPFYEGTKRKEIVTVGRIDKNKNQRMLVDAFIPLAEEFPEWNVIMYGDGDEREELEKKVLETGLEDRILFFGVQDNIAEKIEAASIFVLSSKQEGMPNALIEAMSLGLAVISTDCPCGGPSDLIVPGENGILIPVDDTKKMTLELRKMMEDDKTRNELSLNARLIRERVNPCRVNEEWECYLTEVANRKKRK